MKRKRAKSLGLKPIGPPRLNVRKPKEIKPRNMLVTIDLRRGHLINDTHYGPGKVTVKRSRADLLLEQERNAQNEEIRFRDTNPMGRIIGRGGRIRLVAAEDFHQAFDAVPGMPVS